MADEPTTPKATGSDGVRLSLVGQALKRAGETNNDPQMTAEGKRALRLGQKAMREGKAGLVTDGTVMAIVER